ncbi:MAG: hypothetical protein E7813_20480 [Bradyrhizobium sp.]|uniref:TfuA-like protein n=1 Tax=Bradyrhizobium sp. TaxID=376 RepID=UPI001210C315|nr:TfuA-like protein [Bradyrhizobium sp.]THD62546.1 MAG: hypothetical protein E7813_20480 [Bradyrhizobium sp.]
MDKLPIEGSSLTIVYAGPSLRADPKHRICPSILLMPPAQCGDILMARRLRPQAIALIDGVFEQNAAVWHKEILLAMEDGIRVYGSSSMGALRAAELHTFGMIGVGTIFSDYRDGLLLDDDEVAVRFVEAPWGYSCISDPMVNIRASVFRALQSGLLTSTECRSIIDINKRRFYSERNLADSIPEALGAHRNKREIEGIAAYFKGNGYVDQKQIDADTLMRQLLVDKHARTPHHIYPPVFRSVFLRKLQGDVLCRTFKPDTPGLPASEAASSRALSNWPQHIGIFQRLAVLLAAASSLSSGPTSAVNPNRAARLQKIEQWLETTRRTYKITKPTVNRFRKYLLVLHSPNPARIRAPGDAIPSAAFYWAAKIWAAIDAVAIEHGFHPAPGRVERLSDEFRKGLGLETTDDTFKWISRARFNLLTYRRFLQAYDRMLFLCDGFNMQLLGIASPVQDSVCWISDALSLIGATKNE